MKHESRAALSSQISSLLAAVVILASVTSGCSQDSSFGHFVGTVQVEWITQDREMKLLQDFSYVDANGENWLAPTDSVINGASIPPVFWSVVGPPFVGEYRNASIVHDVACDERKVAWSKVHRMFYEACRCGGVSEIKAKMMYGAVHHFGPRWELDDESALNAAIGTNEEENLHFDGRNLDLDKQKEILLQLQEFSKRNPTLDEIDQFMVDEKDTEE